MYLDAPLNNKTLYLGGDGYLATFLKTLPSSQLRNLTFTTRRHSIGGLFFDLNNLTPEILDSCCNFDTIIFGIANSSPEDCAKNYDAAYNLNVFSTIDAIDIFLKAGVKVLFLSSDAADLTCSPMIGSYASMKSTVEHRFQDHKLFKYARLSYVFSMYDRFTQYLLYCAKNGITAEIYEPFYRNIIHISDVAEALLIIVSNWDLCSKSCYNLYGSISMSRIDMAKIFQSYFSELEFKVVAPPDSFAAQRALYICPNFSDTKFLISRKPKHYSSIFTEGA